MSYSITINYEVSGDTTPLTPEDFIIASESNPTSVNAGDTVVLNFKADGMYFAFKSRKGASATGATLSWKCPSPYTEASITLSEVTSDVVITLIAVVKIAPQLVGKPFLYQLEAPVDTRLVLSKRDMREAFDAYLPDIYFALCKDDGHFYLYNKTIEPNSETGKFRLITDSIKQTLKNIDGGEIV